MIVNGLLEPASPLAAVAVRVNGPYVLAVPHAGVHVITPFEVLSDAPLGNAGLTDHVTGPVAQLVSITDGVTVSRLNSTTVCGVEIAATVTGAVSIVRLAAGPAVAGVILPLEQSRRTTLVTVTVPVPLPPLFVTLILNRLP